MKVLIGNFHALT